MKYSLWFKALLVSLLAATWTPAATAQSHRDPVDYVNPRIGSLGHLLTGTTTTVLTPFGMVRIVPNTTGGPERLFATRITGFPAGGAVLMPISGPFDATANHASEFDRDFEVATPYYGSEVLDRYGITVEFTAAARAVCYQFAFPKEQPARLLMEAGAGEITASGADTVTGFSGGGPRNYFYAVFSKPFTSSQNYRTRTGGNRGGGGGSGGAGNAGLALDFTLKSGEKISVRVGASYISVEEARSNLLADIPKADFEKAKAAAQAVWNRELGRLAVKGGTEKQRVIFYTALYRSLCRQPDITEAGDRYFSGYDHKVHAGEGLEFYPDDAYWDTYHCLHPLQLLLDPQRQLDMVRSAVKMYEQSGWLPTVPGIGGDRAAMIAHHATAFITDVYMKGFRDFDVEKAYAGMRKNAMEASMLPWHIGPLTSLDRVYLEKGFFPALAKGETETVPEVHRSERRQAVSVTLENCYDDWCLAQMAKALHKDDDYALFMKRARNYENVFDSRIGFMAPKTADGSWVTPFDPKLGGGQGGRDYFTEMNSWTYTFNVVHDIGGLAALLGGREALGAKLDALFTEGFGTSKWAFLGQFPDSTGLIGQYAHGNEQSFHIPYLYNYVGEPWKAQFRVRQIMNIWYDDSPWGLAGDDDGGAMSSWYVLSAMGFYPVTVGSPVYDIGSPLFEEVRLSSADGKSFKITAHHVSDQNKYVQSATLNGRPLNVPRFAHSAIVNGGSLVLEMGPRPNKQWGSGPESWSQPKAN